VTSGSDPADPRARARHIVAEVLASAAGQETAAARSAPDQRSGAAVPAEAVDADVPGEAVDAAVADEAVDVAVAGHQTAGTSTPATIDDGSIPAVGAGSSEVVAPRTEAGAAAHRIVLAVLAAQQGAEGAVVGEDDAAVDGEDDAAVVGEDDVPVVGEAQDAVVGEDDAAVAGEAPAIAAEAPEPEQVIPEPVAVAAEPEPDAVASEPEPVAIPAEDRMRQLFASSAPEVDEDGSPADEPELVDGDAPWSLDGDLTTTGTAPSRTGRWLLATILGAIALALLFPLAVAALRQVLALS
jgi:hypothetical protein